MAAGSITYAATLPPGFTESLVASGLANPTAMAFAPDGRLFVCEQGGRLRVIKDGVLLPTPFVTITVDPTGERGLLGVAFDPDFLTNQYVYVYYTATSPATHNRISRFTANGDVAVTGSQVVLLDLDNTNDTNHNGGAIHFGQDGKLYAAVGDDGVGSNAQTLANLKGKMLRINADGTIPPDNPFYNTAIGRNRAIWALGLRNPFTFSVQPGTGAIFINDVGQETWEEINDGVAGANYGWPMTEGATSDPRFRSPRYVYNHGAGCAITGGAFYDPLVVQYPAEYIGDYFFADYCSGWIRKLDPVGNIVSGFASGIASPVDLQVSADGDLYYLARGFGSTTGVVYRIQFGANAPSITSHPVDVTVRPGEPATFSVSASGTPTLRYQWRRNDANISGATAATYTIPSPTLSDHGATFRAIVTNDHGSATSNAAILTVSSNQRPTAAIVQPAIGTLYSGGDLVVFAGSGADQEDGDLPAAAYTWQVDFHHNDHIHPFMQPTGGMTGGSVTIPTGGETSANVWYRIYLTVRDSEGATDTTFRDVLPRKSRVTLATNPPGLQLKLDGAPVTAPISFDGVVGIVRSVEAVSPQTVDGVRWAFESWSDGGASIHDIATPATDTTYTATLVPQPAVPGFVAHWNMDAASVTGARLADESGLGNHGTISGATLSPGVIGESLSFAGVDAHVDVVGAPALDTAAGFTVAFWYLADENSGSIIAKPYGTGGLPSWQFAFDGTDLSFTSTDGTATHRDAAAAPAAGVWVHVAGTWDGVTKRLFVNGTQVVEAARSVAMDGEDVVFGGIYASGQLTALFKGRVDDARIYDHALTTDEIAQLYESASADHTRPSVPIGVTATPVSHSRIDLSWQAATDDTAVAGYRIFRDGLPIATSVGIVYTDTGLNPSTTHSYEVAAFDGAGNQSARSAQTIATTGAAPVLAAITVMPAAVVVPLGGTQTFTAQGRDQYGDPIASAVTWAATGGGGIDTSGLFTATTAGGPFTVTAQQDSISGSASVTVDGRIVDAQFGGGTDGFVYIDDAFRGTAQPGYASGVRVAAEGFSGGGLKVTLGGINDTIINGMSGGWRRTFTLASAQQVVLSFRYRLTQTSEYEADEFSEVIVRLDALQPGTGGADYVARIVGDGNGGVARTTGWQLFEVNVGSLAAGTHTLTIGAYNNRKTLIDEITDVVIDDVVIASAGPPPVLASITVTPASATVPQGGTQQFTAQGQDQFGKPIAATVTWSASGGGSINAAGVFTASTPGSPFTITAQNGAISGTASVTVTPTANLIEGHFDAGADGFVYVDDAFRGTAQPGYASGVRSAAEGFSGGALKVTLGGINNTIINGMSGGWRRSFSLPSPSPVTLSFRYRLTQTSEYEANEFSEVIVRLDALQPGTGGADYVARIVGDGNGGVAPTTGWQLFEVNVGSLAAGTHTLTIGGYNNRKNASNEITNVLIDDLVVTSAGGPPPVLTSIAVTPASAIVSLGSTQAFTAQGYDQYGNPIAAAVAWTVSGGGTISSAGIFTATTAGGPFTVSAQDGAVSGAATVTVAATTTLVAAHFDTTEDGFAYLDDPFRGTAQPGYAAGVRSAAEGFSGGGLKVTLGGIDDFTIVGMSGGWRRTFSLASDAPVTLSFRYRLTQTSEFESDELSEVIVRVDAMQPGTGSADYIAQVVGDGNGGTARTTGWQIFEVNLGTLAAGTHTLTIGGYNNKKTFADETTEVLIDDIVVTIVR
jgi:glucose/arabinose dehydrogenase